MKRELLEVERLIRDDQRFTIADHEKWQTGLRAAQAHPAPAVEIDDALADPTSGNLSVIQGKSKAGKSMIVFDSIDDALADPIHDHAPACRSNKSKSRLLGILDEIERGNG